MIVKCSKIAGNLATKQSRMNILQIRYFASGRSQAALPARFPISAVCSWQFGSSEMPYVFLTSDLPSMRNPDSVEAHLARMPCLPNVASRNFAVGDTHRKQMPCEM